MSESTVLSIDDMCTRLQPLFDIGDVRELNGPSGYMLAELIGERDASDLTVREVLALLERVSEWANRRVPA